MVAMLTAVPCLALLTDWSTLLNKTEELLPLALQTKALCQSVPREQLLWEGTASRLESKVTCTCRGPQQYEGFVAPVAHARPEQGRSCPSTRMQTALLRAGFGPCEGVEGLIKAPNGRLYPCRLSVSCRCWDADSMSLCSAT